MQKRVAILTSLAAVASFSLGAVVGQQTTSATPAVAATSAKTVYELAPECRAALNVANEGLGLAISGLGQAQSAAGGATTTPNAASPALSVISATSGRVQALLQQYNADQAACRSRSAVPAITAPN